MRLSWPGDVEMWRHVIYAEDGPEIEISSVAADEKDSAGSDLQDCAVAQRHTRNINVWLTRTQDKDGTRLEIERGWP